MVSVKDIMTKEVITVTENSTVFDVAELMDSKAIGCLIVKQSDTPVGIITERDLVRRVIAKKLPYSTKIFEVMTKNIHTTNVDTPIKEAARIMATNKIRRLPVLKDGKLVGIVVASDFVRNQGKKTLTEEILEAMARSPPSYIDYGLR